MVGKPLLIPKQNHLQQMLQIRLQNPQLVMQQRRAQARPMLLRNLLLVLNQMLAKLLLRQRS